MNELCPHGRSSGAYCEPCAEKEYPPPCYGPLPEGVLNKPTNEVKVSTGLIVKPSARQVNGDHYKSMAIQPSEFIYRNALDWYEGNAVKYICRHRIKGGKVDVEKAIHYLELLLEVEYPNDIE